MLRQTEIGNLIASKANILQILITQTLLDLVSVIHENLPNVPMEIILEKSSSHLDIHNM